MRSWKNPTYPVLIAKHSQRKQQAIGHMCDDDVLLCVDPGVYCMAGSPWDQGKREEVCRVKSDTLCSYVTIPQVL